MSSTFPTSNPKDLATDAKDATGDLKSKVADSLNSSDHHSLKHHLRNTTLSATEALGHAREALQKVVASAQAGGEPIAVDLKNVLSELDHSIHALKREGGEQLDSLRHALQEYADRIRQIAREGVGQAKDRAVRSVDYTQKRVAKDPIKAIGLAAGAGLVAGLIWASCCNTKD